jgi:hypothetical protein
MGETKDELVKSFRQSQEKYVYYIVALNITAVGFVAHETYDEKLRVSLWILLPSIGLWLYSVYNGLEFLKLNLSTLFANHKYLDLEQLPEPNGASKQEIKEALSEIKGGMEDNSETAKKYFERMNCSLIWGIVLFVIWRLVDMLIPFCTN